MLDEEQLIKTEIWKLYEKSVTFMGRMNIYTDTDKNFRFYNGDQLAGLKVEGVEKVQYNFIKPIVKHKVTTITQNLFAVNYSPENIENVEFIDLAQKTCELLNKKASKAWDKDFMDLKVKKWTRTAAINDEAICYVTYDENTDLPINEMIAKNDIMFGNENDNDIQNQPYILIRQRMNVMDVRKIAKKNHVNELDINTITGDSDVSTASGEAAKYELDDKCWFITKFYKKDGDVYFSQATKYVDIKKDKKMGTKLYPIAHFNWEEEEGSARGCGEVRNLIPNQLETNKTAMRRAFAVKTTAYPQKVVNVDSIINPSAVNKVGATIKFKDMGNTRASDVFMNSTPAQMSSDSEKLQTELISYSRELNNASEVTTGSVNPEQASGKAILAVQNAQNQPLDDQLTGLKTFIEDIARIWFEMWKVYASDGLNIEVEQADPVTGEKSTTMEQVPSYILDALETSVKVDVTPKGAYDRYAQELSLENLLSKGIITFEEYVESLDADSVMPKTKLEQIIKKRHEAQQQISAIQEQADMMKLQAQTQQADAASIGNIAAMGNDMINQAVSNQGNEATQ